MPEISRRQFVTAAAAVAGASLLPSSVAALVQDPVTNARAGAAERVAWRALPFPLKQVRLLPGPAKSASERNSAYMKSLNNDRLLHSFRLTAGLPSNVQPYGGWEKPDVELRGHFNGGHFLSACALAYAGSGDEELKKKGDALVTELAKCQAADGYLSAFPTELFDRLRDGKRVWAPFYTLHKIMAGHLDMYTLAGNQQALETVQKMAGWVQKWAEPLPYDHMQRVLKNEYGGMGEVLANLSAVTGRSEYLDLARRFDKASFYDPLAARRDELKGLHVNTHIPQVIAAARAHELSGEQRFRTIAEYFWDEVVSRRSYATGGTSNREIWDTDPGQLSKALGPSTTEDCCAYNMMKLTRHLFGWSADARYMDHYERLLFSHRLGTMDPATGTTMYYLPLQSGLWKTYATPEDSFWCCNGTGVEEFAKLADTIYFHDDRSLYVNLYLPSELEWPEKNLKLRQETRFPEEQGTALTISAPKPVALAIRLRVPYWTRDAKIKVNGRSGRVAAAPGTYATLNGPWKNGDRIEVSLPMHLHAAPMPDDPAVQAVMYGPVVLAGRLQEDPRDGWYGREGPTRDGAISNPPVTGDIVQPESWVESVNGQPLTFRTAGQSQSVTLVPLSAIVHERYVVYWNVSPRRA